jgi:hypothetical protein
MLSPSMYSPPRSLHRSVQIFHCLKQCCGLSSESLFVSSITFTITASVDSNLVPFNADLIFGNKKKSHGARSNEYDGCSNTVILLFHQKRLDKQSVMCWCVVLMKNPWAVHPHFRSSSSSHPFTKVCQNLLVLDLVNGWPSGTQSMWKIASMLKETIIFALKLYLLYRAFFCLGELGLFQSIDWRLLSVSCWKNHDSSQVITFFRSLGCFQCFEESHHKCSSKFPFVQEWGDVAPSLNTLFSCQTVSLSVLFNSATARMLSWRFCWTFSPTFLC